MIKQGFETSAQTAVYDKVAVWMREIFGEFAFISEDSPAIGVNVGSAFAVTFVFPWSENDAIIDTVARVVSDVSLI